MLSTKNTKRLIHILKELKRHGFSPSERTVIKGIFDTNSIKDFYRWLKQMEKSNEASS